MFVVLQSLSRVWLLRPHWVLPSLSPGVCSDSCPLSRWCYLAIYPLLLLLPSMFPSIRVFCSELALLIRWPKCWSFSFSSSPSNGYSGLISFRIDWFDLLAVQGALQESLFQHHSLKASVLLHSAFFMVQLLHPYMTTGKTIFSMRSECIFCVFTWLSSVWYLLYEYNSFIVFDVYHLVSKSWLTLRLHGL